MQLPPILDKRRIESPGFSEKSADIKITRQTHLLRDVPVWLCKKHLPEKMPCMDQRLLSIRYFRFLASVVRSAAISEFARTFASSSGSIPSVPVVTSVCPVAAGVSAAS